MTGTGAIAFIYQADDSVTIQLVGWKGNKSLRAYVAKNDRIHYLRLLGADTSKYEKNKFEMQRSQEASSTTDKNGSGDAVTPESQMASVTEAEESISNENGVTTKLGDSS